MSRTGVRTTKENGGVRAAQYARNLIEASLDPLVTISAQGKITDVNEATAKVTGVQREKLIGTDFSDYFTEPDKAREGYRRVFAEGFVTDYPLVIRHRNGRLTDVLYNATVYKDSRGQVLGAFAAARDVTAQKQASQYARSLIEASLDPLVTISPEGTITDVNEAAAKVTGVPRAELIGTDFSEYFTEPDKAREGYQRVFAEGFVTDYPLTIRHRDGRLTDVLYNASVYRDSLREVLGVFAAARDVTARKRAEEKNLQLAAIVQSSDDAIIGKTLDGIVTSWNRGAERIYGYTESDILGQPVSILAPPERAEESLRLIERLRRGETIEHYETVRRRKDGQLIDVSLAVSAIKDVNGRMIAVSTVGHDITQQKRAEEALRRAHDELDRRVQERTAELAAANEAIRELSTPVLPAIKGLLIVPLIGAVDAMRARQLTEQLLKAIRQNRAKAVVMDITGVATIDSTVANHLVKTAEAARLLGAEIILTGVSTAVAQALVTLGLELRKLRTLVDLQSGIEEARRLLEGDQPS